MNELRRTARRAMLGEPLLLPVAQVLQAVDSDAELEEMECHGRPRLAVPLGVQ